MLLALQLTLPRRWAVLPLLIAACHTPYGPNIGGFTVARMVIVVGLLRATSSGMFRWDWRAPLDRWVMILSAVAIFSSVAHQAIFSNPLIFRIGFVINVLGTYLYGRAYLFGDDVLERLAMGLALVLAVFAVFMVLEKQSGFNPYAKLGASITVSLVREGKIRAQGPFGTAILAGTAGACAIPIFVSVWRTRRRLALAGLASSAVIIYCSASSGPIGTVLLGAAAMALWWARGQLRAIQIGTLLLLIVLHFVKERPVWYLMALMDFVGGSTGWHRAALIDAGVKHLGEWWLLGTELTGHWMPYALPSNVPGIGMVDLTNYYLHLGVIGGLPLVFCLWAVQWTSFKSLGRRIREMRWEEDAREFDLWCVGSALFAHSITFLSISYFDQMYVFFWIIVGSLPALLAAAPAPESVDSESVLTDSWEMPSSNMGRASEV